MRSPVLRSLALAALALILAPGLPLARQQQHYAPLEQIGRNSVTLLEVAWSWGSDSFNVPPEIRNEATPIFAGGRLFFPTGSRRAVVAVDAGSGETLWMWKMDEGARWEKAQRRVSRGVAHWTDGRDERIFTITPGMRLVALDARTGQPVPSFGQDGMVDLFRELGGGDALTGTIGNSSPPAIADNVVVVGPAFVEMSRPRTKRQTKGDVMGFDARTGKKLWTFHTIPRAGEPGAETWLNGSAEFTGNAGVWAPMAVDEALGHVYLPVESATGDYYGGQRPGHNLYTSSLVALDIRTGRRVWHQQLVHHDIWDYDIASPPMLVDITVDGRPIKAIVQLTKQAFAYVFDRETGRPVWPIEERPVPKSTVPSEWTAATQPFPTKPAPFDRQGVTEADLIDFTPELRRLAIDALNGYQLGPLYTPASMAAGDAKGTFVLPGNLGGSNWEGGAVDPDTGYVYVGSATRPNVYALTTPKPGESDLELIATSLNPPEPTVDGLWVVKPPYGRITAYNMHSGEIAWQVPNGPTPPQIRNHPRLQGLDIPATGTRARAMLLVTKSLLFAASGWSNDYRGETPTLRAYDKATGQQLWEQAIPGGNASGVPMSYMHDGRQYIAFFVGNAAARTPSRLIAFALPNPPKTTTAGR